MSIVNIKVNGVDIKADSEKNLLLNLLDAGFDIPNLCYREDLKVYGGCGLCLVELKKANKPLRSCVIMPTEGMEVTTDSERIRKSRRTILALILSDHRGDCRPPCRNACPTNQDVQGYVGLIANGQYAEALELIKQDNPLPASIGRVCPHPCEKACRRDLLEAPVSICHLKRFAADLDEGYLPSRKPATGKTVAVVGAGPAGLSAAYFLAREGHSVEIFEAMSAPGGMLRYGIPAYRLPKDVIDREVAVIEALGVKINYNKALGRDFSLDELKNQYNAVFVAVGAWKSSALGCEGDSLPGVVGGIDMLAEVALGKKPDIGERVAVVGGGNTAIDAVRTSVRLGAREVTLIYRRTEAEMPAEPIEIEEAKEEGVKFMFLCAPERVVEKDGRAVGLQLQEMKLGEPDASGRRRPVPIEGATRFVEFDTVIAAIGQKVKGEGLDGLEMHRWNTIKADEGTFMTSVEGVFAGGDAVNNGPGIAISAIAHGKNAAKAIGSFLAGKLTPVEQPFLVERKDFAREDIPADIMQAERVPVKVADENERKCNFSEIAEGYTDVQAREEASRCLECGCGSLYDCKLLPLLREYDAVGMGVSGRARKLAPDSSNPFIRRDNNKCLLCGLCVRLCREKAGLQALGYYGRGFDTDAECAFRRPLAESECSSCGLCVAACPTGALQERHAFAKTPPLPLEKETVTCLYCEKGCKFELHRFGGRLLKALPLGKEYCGIGRFGMVLAGDAALELNESEQTAVFNAVTGNLDAFEGDRSKLTTLAELRELLAKK